MSGTKHLAQGLLSPIWSVSGVIKVLCPCPLWHHKQLKCRTHCGKMGKEDRFSLSNVGKANLMSCVAASFLSTHRFVLFFKLFSEWHSRTLTLKHKWTKLGKQKENHPYRGKNGCSPATVFWPWNDKKKTFICHSSTAALGKTTLQFWINSKATVALLCTICRRKAEVQNPCWEGERNLFVVWREGLVPLSPCNVKFRM